MPLRAACLLASIALAVICCSGDDSRDDASGASAGNTTQASSGSGGGAVSCLDHCINLCQGGLCDCYCGDPVTDCAACPTGKLCVTTTIAAGEAGGTPQVTRVCGELPTTCSAALDCTCANFCYPHETCSLCNGAICCDSAAP